VGEHTAEDIKIINDFRYRDGGVRFTGPPFLFFKMTKYKIIFSEDLKEESHGDTKTTKILETDNFNIAKVRKTGNNIRLGYDTESDVAYYIIDGEGDAIIEGKTYHFKKGDCIFYPKGTKYKHLKGLTLLAISSPPFDRSKRVYVE
jgi:mannose-6-phosphate isomerase-like protein (cupin superfamily)